jgi:hypothetical protein
MAAANGYWLFVSFDLCHYYFSFSDSWIDLIYPLIIIMPIVSSQESLIALYNNSPAICY